MLLCQSFCQIPGVSMCFIGLGIAQFFFILLVVFNCIRGINLAADNHHYTTHLSTIKVGSPTFSCAYASHCFIKFSRGIMYDNLVFLLKLAMPSPIDYITRRQLISHGEFVSNLPFILKWRKYGIIDVEPWFCWLEDELILCLLIFFFAVYAHPYWGRDRSFGLLLIYELVRHHEYAVDL